MKRIFLTLAIALFSTASFAQTEPPEINLDNPEILEQFVLRRIVQHYESGIAYYETCMGGSKQTLMKQTNEQEKNLLQNQSVILNKNFAFFEKKFKQALHENDQVYDKKKHESEIKKSFLKQFGQLAIEAKIYAKDRLAKEDCEGAYAKSIQDALNLYAYNDHTFIDAHIDETLAYNKQEWDGYSQAEKQQSKDAFMKTLKP